VYSQTPHYDLNLKQVALDLAVSGNGRNVLECKVNGGHFVIGSVQLGKQEQFMVDLIFDKGQPVEFVVHGKSSIHLSGFYLVDNEPFINVNQENIVASSSSPISTVVQPTKKQKNRI